MQPTSMPIKSLTDHEIINMLKDPYEEFYQDYELFFSGFMSRNEIYDWVIFLENARQLTENMLQSKYSDSSTRISHHSRCKLFLGVQLVRLSQRIYRKYSIYTLVSYRKYFLNYRVKLNRK